MPKNIFWDDEHERNPSWCLYIENNWKQLTDPQNLFWKKAKFVFFDIRRCRLKFLTWYKPIVSVLETAALWPGCVAHFLYLSLGTGDLREGRWWDGPHTGIAHHAPQRKLAIIITAAWWSLSHQWRPVLCLQCGMAWCSLFPNHCLFRHLQWSKTLSLSPLSLILLTAKILIDHDHQVTVSESTVNIDIILRVSLV